MRSSSKYIDLLEDSRSRGFTESFPGPAATSPRHPINARPVRAEARRVRSLARPGIDAHPFEPGGELEGELLPGEEEIRESRRSAGRRRARRRGDMEPEADVGALGAHRLGHQPKAHQQPEKLAAQTVAKDRLEPSRR